MFWVIIVILLLLIVLGLAARNLQKSEELKVDAERERAKREDPAGLIANLGAAEYRLARQKASLKRARGAAWVAISTWFVSFIMSLLVLAGFDFIGIVNAGSLAISLLVAFITLAVSVMRAISYLKTYAIVDALGDVLNKNKIL